MTVKRSKEVFYRIYLHINIFCICRLLKSNKPVGKNIHRMHLKCVFITSFIHQCNKRHLNSIITAENHFMLYVVLMKFV